MQRHLSQGLAYHTFRSLEAFPELVHAVTSRHGGVSIGRFASLNLSISRGDDPDAVRENVDRVCAALGLPREHVVSPGQRHTADIYRVTPEDRGRIVHGYDALVTDVPDTPLLLRYADCTPILIYDPVHRALAVVHSGWRGTVQAIARAAVEALVRDFGAKPADMVAAIGPSIGPCCYEVGDDVVHAVRGAFALSDDLLAPTDRQNGRWRFNLWAANRRWLQDAGVRQIEVGEICTACRTDEFYSHRAEAGQTGHFGAVMMLRRRV